mmetsp:Transcript_41912/g.65382  ORF Transcript_41912/g.65382 Transcript_41912/m.65382 type:complete len:476 (-) Transcript_41912:15-1442(-)
MIDAGPRRCFVEHATKDNGNGIHPSTAAVTIPPKCDSWPLPPSQGSCSKIYEHSRHSELRQVSEVGAAESGGRRQYQKGEAAKELKRQLKALIDDFARTRIEISQKFLEVESATLSSSLASPNKFDGAYTESSSKLREASRSDTSRLRERSGNIRHSSSMQPAETPSSPSSSRIRERSGNIRHSSSMQPSEVAQPDLSPKSSSHSPRSLAVLTKRQLQLPIGAVVAENGLEGFRRLNQDISDLRTFLRREIESPQWGRCDSPDRKSPSTNASAALSKLALDRKNSSDRADESPYQASSSASTTYVADQYSGSYTPGSQASTQSSTGIGIWADTQPEGPRCFHAGDAVSHTRHMPRSRLSWCTGAGAGGSERFSANVDKCFGALFADEVTASRGQEQSPCTTSTRPVVYSGLSTTNSQKMGPTYIPGVGLVEGAKSVARLLLPRLRSSVTWQADGRRQPIATALVASDDSIPLRGC